MHIVDALDNCVRKLGSNRRLLLRRQNLQHLLYHPAAELVLRKFQDLTNSCFSATLEEIDGMKKQLNLRVGSGH